MSTEKLNDLNELDSQEQWELQKELKEHPERTAEILEKFNQHSKEFNEELLKLIRND